MNNDNIIGQAQIGDVTRNLITIDKTKLKELGVVRVMWRDEQGRRVTSFVKPEQLITVKE